MAKKKEENVQIGMRIKAAREAAGYTQERLAELVDVSAQYISGLERGVVGLSIPNLVKLCKVLSVSSDELLMGGTQPSGTADIVARMERLPAEHIKNMEKLLNCYMEGIAITLQHDF